jgi:hypothetical protein
MLPSTLAIPNSAAGLVSISLVLPTTPSPSTRRRVTFLSSSTFTLASLLPPVNAETPGNSQSGSLHPGHSPVGEVRKSCHREEGVERPLAGVGEEESVEEGGKVPQVAQVGLRERALIER